MIFKLEFDNGKENGSNSGEYEVEVIWDSTVYVRESEGHLSSFYYLVLWKGYLEEENI